MRGGGRNLLINKIKRPFRVKAHKFFEAFKAFTLAEVLVTLTILGILASIVVPNVIQQYEKRVTITKLKKAYATLEGAAANLASATGCMGKGLECTGLMEISDDKIFNDRFVELSGLKYTSIINEGWIKPKTLITGSDDNTNMMTHIYVGTDNIAYNISKISSFNAHKIYGESAKTAIRVLVMTEPKGVYRDNPKLKNGRTVFSFLIYDNFIVEPTVIVFGGQYSVPSQLTDVNCNNSDYETYNYCSKFSKEYIDSYCNTAENASTEGYNGMNCAAKIIKDGWKINY